MHDESLLIPTIVNTFFQIFKDKRVNKYNGLDGG